MVINKQISVGSLDVEPEEGKIWLNSPNCILRIQNLKFNHIEDKFAMIDIVGDNAYMIPGDYGLNLYCDFLEKLNLTIHSEVVGLNEEKQQKFLDSLLNEIQVYIKQNKSEDVKNDTR